MTKQRTAAYPPNAVDRLRQRNRERKRRERAAVGMAPLVTKLDDMHLTRKQVYESAYGWVYRQTGPTTKHRTPEPQKKRAREMAREVVAVLDEQIARQQRQRAQMTEANKRYIAAHPEQHRVYQRAYQRVRMQALKEGAPRDEVRRRAKEAAIEAVRQLEANSAG
ncbi:MAG TPA: hypothetical protein VMV29_03620 [Ktedonobacterales bacterium]|nr:hypothetical protein [Ktedonobacterales bacterium]